MHLQGVILYEMLSGSCPFTEEDEVKLREQITTADYVLDKLILDQISDKAQDLIKKLLVVDPEERLSSEQILCHPWLQVTTMGQLRCLNSLSGSIKEIGLTLKVKIYNFATPRIRL